VVPFWHSLALSEPDFGDLSQFSVAPLWQIIAFRKKKRLNPSYHCQVLGRCRYQKNDRED
jgi:hypothetical protein